MNCQDIARLLDEREVDSLLATEQSEVQAHLATCRDCARDWQIQAQLANAAIPAVPVELRAHYAAQVAGAAARSAPRRGRFIVIGAIAAVAAAAAMLALRMNGSIAPVAATAASVPAEPTEMQVPAPLVVLASPREPLSEDESKALAEWTQRVGEWLSVRDDPDALITAAMLLMSSAPDARRIQLLLQRATTLAPTNARIHATAMLLCLELKACDTTPYEQAMRRLAPDNALGWAMEVDRSSRADDKEALRNALTAMSRARTFDIYWGADILSMTAQMRAALVAPPDIDGYNPSKSSSATVIGILAAMPIPAFAPITKACKAATDDRTLLTCHQIGAAMRVGDTVLVNAIGLTISGSGLPTESAEARSLAQQRNQIQWIMRNEPVSSGFPADDPEYLLRAFANHPRELDAARALLEEQGIPTEPPADWKP